MPASFILTSVGGILKDIEVLGFFLMENIREKKEKKEKIFYILHNWLIARQEKMKVNFADTFLIKEDTASRWNRRKESQNCESKNSLSQCL